MITALEGVMDQRVSIVSDPDVMGLFLRLLPREFAEVAHKQAGLRRDNPRLLRSCRNVADEARGEDQSRGPSSRRLVPGTLKPFVRGNHVATGT